MNYTKGERIYYEAKDTDGNKSYIIMAGLGILGKFKFEGDAQLDVAAPFLYEALKKVKLVWAGLDPNIRFPHLQEVIDTALAKTEDK